MSNDNINPDIPPEEVSVPEGVSENLAKLTLGGSRDAAILVKNGEIVAEGYDQCVELNDPVAIAVAQCLRTAGRRNDHAELELYCSPNPDMLAAGIIVQFGIGRLYVRGSSRECPVLDFIRSHGIPVITMPQR